MKLKPKAAKAAPKSKASTKSRASRSKASAKASAKAGLGVAAGDVYAGRLRDGRFGAVHVLEVITDGQRRGRDSATLVCTSYIGTEPPGIEDGALRSVLRRNRFRFKNDPAVMIVDEPPPAAFMRVGSFAPTAEELGIDPMGTYGSGWRIMEDVLLEWRWEHDREAFEREVRAAAEARSQPKPPPSSRKRTPRSTLTETDFWALL